jgi:hypothetical protein
MKMIFPKIIKNRLLNIDTWAGSVGTMDNGKMAHNTLNLMWYENDKLKSIRIDFKNVHEAESLRDNLNFVIENFKTIENEKG